MEKRGGKSGGLIDEKPPKLGDKTRRKTNRCRGCKTSKTLAWKTIEENRMLID